mmetsp:Transcript_33426/g.53542  ORF Transcript_33426/g.53542 Transcript_33426/m.53542 type:complete len:127 (+) Transcript_33426:65-445(+)
MNALKLLRGTYSSRIARPTSSSFSPPQFMKMFRRSYIPINARDHKHMGVTRLTKAGANKIIYGGSFRPIGLLDTAPFTLFMTWLTFALLLFYFGACHPEEYYLSMARYSIYAFYMLTFFMARGIYF